ncbi:MAG: hypothetical protein Q4G43_02490 [Mobilicoccus sp.]|nr:hypothetical protein [Mobilicoccus sp.]
MSETDDLDLMTVAMDSALEQLDPDRIWLMGIVRLNDTPLDVDFTAEQAVEVIDLARVTTQFPSGPFDFIPGGYTLVNNPDHRIATLHSDEVPHLEASFGFGPGGIMATGFSRGDILDDGTPAPGAVVLTDLESVIADTVVLGCAAAVTLGYTGPMEAMIGIGAPDGATLTYLEVDDMQGGLVALDRDVEEFRPVRGTFAFTLESVARDAHVFLLELSTQAAAQLGTVPQLTPMLSDDAVQYEGGPLHHRLEEAAGPKVTQLPTRLTPTGRPDER